MVLKRLNKVSAAVCLLATLPFTVNTAWADDSSNNSVSVTVDGKEMNCDVPAYIDSVFHQTMVPIRSIAESIGAQVQWDAKHQAVLINTPSYPSNIHAQANSISVFINGQLLQSDAPAKMQQDRVVVPIRAISKALKATVLWDQASNRVQITTQQAINEFNSEESKVNDVLRGVGLAPHIASDGTKEFTLVAEPHGWEPVKGVITNAWTYNDQVPGPVIRVTEGDHVRVTLINKLPEPTTIHWHGLHLPNAMDGVPDITQKPVQPGQSFVYEFTASHPGTFMYHSHVDDMKQVGKGLRGAFIIDPNDPSSETKYDHDYTMLLSGFHLQDSMEGDEDYFTMNGRSYPDTPPIVVKKGETVRLRLINIDPTEWHTMHLHGMDFQVIAKDGHSSNNSQKMNTLAIGPGETYDFAFSADAIGTWMFHCHVLDHTMNAGDKMNMGGLITLIKVQE